MDKLRVGLLCGGPSLERGISLNSARSVIDHLQAPDIEVFPIYFDLKQQAFELERAHLYSNTPSDFDFKVREIGHPLDAGILADRLREMDIIFPAIHGAFGEDGGVQAYLEHAGIPFVGSGSAACRRAFDKYEAGRYLREQGYATLPALLLTAAMGDLAERTAAFFAEQAIERAIVKPARAGSSVGVYPATTPEDAATFARQIMADGIDERVVVEPFCTGVEFTLIILENGAGQPVALLPTEIGLEMPAQQIFDYRKKYLPTQQVTYHIPPRFDDATVRRIQEQAQALFALFGMHDCVRFDGWVLPDGRIWFSDFNLVSGMEQNSFLFLQAAQLGMSHADLLRFVVANACRRQSIEMPAFARPIPQADKERVNVIFGGDSSERHVSLMSGSNVWLKLLRSDRYDPHPYLLDLDGAVWELPYALTLRHTVEEVTEACHEALAQEERLRHHRQAILARLQPPPLLVSQHDFVPRRLSLADFVAESPLVFIAIHGSIGENGELQAQLEAAGVAYTGSSAAVSRLCMDKFETGQVLAGLESAGIFSAKKALLATHMLEQQSELTFAPLWDDLRQQLTSPSLIIKPSDDGCSSGVVRLFAAADLAQYVHFVAEGAIRIPAHTFTRQNSIVEMPTRKPAHLLLEEFVETDEIAIIGSELRWQEKTGWIEVTVGVLGPEGAVRALTPSITVASGNVLSLEEKFQGGTGVNITPPPPELVAPELVEAARQRIERVARTLGISGFARIDAFLHRHSGDIIVIEANSIPGLTPSTVIYHQALAEPEPVFPTQFLEKILDYRRV